MDVKMHVPPDYEFQSVRILNDWNEILWSKISKDKKPIYSRNSRRDL